MINPEVQQHLTTIIQNHGRVALSDPANVEKLLREAAGDSRDVNLLVMALQSGIPQEITAGTSDVTALASRLENEKFIAADAATAAVQAWATALGANMSVVAVPSVVSSEPVAAVPVAPAPVAPAPVAAAPIAPPPSSPAPTPIAAPPPSSPAPAPVTQAPAPAPAPQAAPYAPHAAAPHPQYAPNQQRAYPPAGGSGPNTGVIIAIVAACVLIAGGGGVFMWLKGRNATATTTPTTVTTPPAVTTTTTTGTGGLGTPPAQPAANGALDMDGLNAKLADWHTRYVAAGTDFQQQVSAASTDTDQNSQLDKFSVAYLKMSETLEVMASELDALTPPAEAASSVQKLAESTRDLSSKIGEGGTIAKSHDSAQFIQNGKDVEAFGATKKSELEATLTAAGYDVANFDATGTLKKK